MTLSGVRFLQYDGVLTQICGHGYNKQIIKLRVRFEACSPISHRSVTDSGWLNVQAEGRAVVDAKSFRRMNPSRAIGGAWKDEYVHLLFSAT